MGDERGEIKQQQKALLTEWNVHKRQNKKRQNQNGFAS